MDGTSTASIPDASNVKMKKKKKRVLKRFKDVMSTTSSKVLPKKID